MPGLIICAAFLFIDVFKPRLNYTLKRAEPNFAETNQIGSEIDS